MHALFEPCCHSFYRESELQIQHFGLSSNDEYTQDDEELYALPRCPAPCPCERKQDEFTLAPAAAPLPHARQALVAREETKPDHEDQERPRYQYEPSYADHEDKGHSSYQYDHNSAAPETRFEHSSFEWEDDAEAVVVCPSPGRGELAEGGLLTARRDGLLTARRAKNEGQNDQEAVERARLQGVVSAFVQRAVRGCTCGYITGSVKSGYERVATQYRMDRSVQNLCILCPAEPAYAEIICPLAAIQDISALVEDGEDKFLPEVLAHLRPEERRLLLMVVFRCQEKLKPFYLLEESEDARDDFLEAVRILCRYAESTREGQAPERCAEPAEEGRAQGAPAAEPTAEGRAPEAPVDIHVELS